MGTLILRNSSALNGASKPLSDVGVRFGCTDSDVGIRGFGHSDLCREANRVCCLPKHLGVQCRHPQLATIIVNALIVG